MSNQIDVQTSENNNSIQGNEIKVKTKKRQRGKSVESSSIRTSDEDNYDDVNRIPTTKSTTKPQISNSSSANNTSFTNYNDQLIQSLQLIDPLLQFLTKATASPLVPFQTLFNIIPKQSCLFLPPWSKVTTTTTTTTNDTLLNTSTQATTTTKLTNSSTNNNNNTKSLLFTYISELQKRGVLCIHIHNQSSFQEIHHHDHHHHHHHHHDGYYNNLSSFLEQYSQNRIATNNPQEKELLCSTNITIGFPPPPSSTLSSSLPTTTTTTSTSTSTRSTTNTDHHYDKNKYNGHDDNDDEKNNKTTNLHGSSKTAAKRRLAYLKASLKADPFFIVNNYSNFQDFHHHHHDDNNNNNNNNRDAISTGNDANDDTSNLISSTTTKNMNPPLRGLNVEMLDGMIHHDKYHEYAVKEQYKEQNQQRQNNTSNEEDIHLCHDRDGDNTKDADYALQELTKFFQCKKGNNSNDYNRQTLQPSSTTSTAANIENTNKMNVNNDSFILPHQAAFAGSFPARVARYGSLSHETIHAIPHELITAFRLNFNNQQQISGTSSNDRTEYSINNHGMDSNQNLSPLKVDSNNVSLYSHQTQAIEAIMNGKHTLVCTGTGSGKSLCFLLPILSKVMQSDIMFESLNTGQLNGNNDKSTRLCTKALIIFPTKALAQDQLTKLQALTNSHPSLKKHLRAGIIDGDTPHPNRSALAKCCNIILTNPDTLHAAILPDWRGVYLPILQSLKYVVIDELHTYEGAFGAHVSLVFSRLFRSCIASTYLSEQNSTMAVNSKSHRLVFVGCSATIGHPEDHFRLLCPISKLDSVVVLTAEDDGSPSAAKHFFVWNPPLIDIHGAQVGKVILPSKDVSKGSKKSKRSRNYKDSSINIHNDSNLSLLETNVENNNSFTRRCHAADETARILAHAVKNSVRCIAFCKTRMLVEWVYDSCVKILQADARTEYLTQRVEVYRGGYSAEVRRSIEKRLFQNELYGVVGTSALELGVDVGGIDLTLHCGYPGSLSSLLQQAGRAGRGNSTNTSFSIMVTFSSPCEQHLWKYPTGLLKRGLCAPPSIPLNAGIVQGHMLCAAQEIPLVGNYPVSVLFEEDCQSWQYDPISLLSDFDLFGSEIVYKEGLESLWKKGSIREEKVNQFKFGCITSYRNHPSIDKSWLRVSLRSIEPISYAIVDMSHPLQDGRCDAIYDKAAILDTIPYSRVFYHAYPGAIIVHRGQKYKIQSMTSPPPFVNSSVGYRYDSSNLGAFAIPTSVRYSTQALSNNIITVVKHLDRVEISEEESADADTVSVPLLSCGCIAGNGVVTIKRTVHGYKKLSHVNRAEISRTEITLPPMEYDTNAIWFDTEASTLNEFIIDYGEGVHALSHAILAVAPLFVPCTSSDIDCDHTAFGCTRIIFFDVRAGGAGTTFQLWKHFFRPDGVLEAAIELLSDCPSCSETGNYRGGCPGCLQSVPCVNFHQDLSRVAALHIARRMLARLKRSYLYIHSIHHQNEINSMNSHQDSRCKAIQEASNLTSAKRRNIVVGRPSWPTDNSSNRHAEDEENIDHFQYVRHSLGGGGFMNSNN